MNSSVLAQSLGLGLCLSLCIRKVCCVSCSWEYGFIKKRSYTVQGLVLQEVSLLYAVYSLLLCFDCSFSQVSLLQNFSLPALGSVWPLARVWWVFNSCTLVYLFKKTLMLFPPELKLYRTLWSVGEVCAGVCAGLLGEGLAALVLKLTFSKKQYLQSTERWGLI